MGKKYVKTDLDRARDELFSHIQRCDVLDAAEEDREAWLDDTMEYMFERYPQLSPVERTQLGVMAQRYMKPIVPHGKDATAQNRDEWQETADAEAAATGTAVTEAEATEAEATEAEATEAEAAETGATEAEAAETGATAAAADDPPADETADEETAEKSGETEATAAA